MRIAVLRELSSTQSAQWRTFLDKARTSHPEQDPRFAEVLRAGGHDVAFSMGFVDGVVVAVGLFAMRPHPFLKSRYGDAMAYSGPVCDEFETLTAFMSGLAEAPEMRNVGRIRVTPYWLNEDGERIMRWFGKEGWRGFERYPMRTTGLIDLRGSDEDILARFNQTGRRKVRKAEKLGLEVHQDLQPHEAADFLDRLNAHHRDRRIGTIPDPVFDALQRNVLMPGELGSIHVVRHEGRFLAGAMMYRSKGTAHFMHSVHDDAELARLDNLRISPFLLYQTMKWARAKGSTTYDIEGYAADPAPDDPAGHIYRYKSEFSPRQVGRVAGHGRVISPFLYVSGNAREILRANLRKIRSRLRRARAIATPVSETKE